MAALLATTPRTTPRTFGLASNFGGEISIRVNGLRIAVFDSAERSETAPNLGPVWRRSVGCDGWLPKFFLAWPGWWAAAVAIGNPLHLKNFRGDSTHKTPRRNVGGPLLCQQKTAEAEVRAVSRQSPQLGRNRCFDDRKFCRHPSVNATTIPIKVRITQC